MSVPDTASKAVRIGKRLVYAHKESGLSGLRAESASLARAARNVTADMAFDLRRGIRTRGMLRHEAELAPLSIGGDPVHYEPVRPRWWREAHASIPVERRTTTLVDLGAGRGRGLILAAEMGFRRVVGVELDERLVTEARENLHRWKTKRRTPLTAGQEISVVHGDAAIYRLPEGSLVLSMYNPFGIATMRRILGQLHVNRTPRTGPVFVTYFHPVHESVFAEIPGFRLHSRGKGWSAYCWFPSRHA